MRTLWWGIAFLVLAGIIIALIWPADSESWVSMRRPFNDPGGNRMPVSLIPVLVVPLLVFAAWEWQRRNRR